MCWAHHFWPALLAFHLFFLPCHPLGANFLHCPSSQLSDEILNVLTASPVYMLSFHFHRNTPTHLC